MQPLGVEPARVRFLRFSNENLKVRVEETDARVPSAVALWPIANWFEREVWDMFGIRFDGLRSFLLLVTAVVHVTDGQFAALYILVNAAAAIVLPFGGAILSAALGLVLYLADVLLVQGTFATTSLTLQLVVFALVMLTSAVSARAQALPDVLPLLPVQVFLLSAPMLLQAPCHPGRGRESVWCGRIPPSAHADCRSVA